MTPELFNHHVENAWRAGFIEGFQANKPEADGREIQEAMEASSRRRREDSIRCAMEMLRRCPEDRPLMMEAIKAPTGPLFPQP